jgi:hypothetical protein
VLGHTIGYRGYAQGKWPEIRIDDDDDDGNYTKMHTTPKHAL